MGCLSYRKKIIISGDLIETKYYKIPVKTNYGCDSVSRVTETKLFEIYKQKVKELNVKLRCNNEKEYKEKYMKCNQRRAKENLKRLIMCNYDMKTSFLTLTFDALATDKRFFRNKDLDCKKVKDISCCMHFIKLFFKRLNYKLKKAPYNKKNNIKYLCVPERQENGNFHFHICLFQTPFIFKEDIFNSWGYGSCKIERFKNRNNLYKYVTKQLIGYVSKNLKDENIDLNKKAYTSSTNLKQPKEYYEYVDKADNQSNNKKELEKYNFIIENNKKFKELVEKLNGKRIKEVNNYKYAFNIKYYNGILHNEVIKNKKSRMIHIVLIEKDSEVYCNEYLCLNDRKGTSLGTVQLFAQTIKENEKDNDIKIEYVESIWIDKQCA